MGQDDVSRCHAMFEQSLRRYNEQCASRSIAHKITSNIVFKPLSHEMNGLACVPTYLLLTDQGHMWWLDQDDAYEFNYWHNQVHKISYMSCEAANKTREQFVAQWIYGHQEVAQPSTDDGDNRLLSRI